MLAACLNLYTIVKFPEYASQTLAADANVSVEQAAGALSGAVVGTALSLAKENPDQVASALQTTAQWAAENPETVRSARRIEKNICSSYARASKSFVPHMFSVPALMFHLPLLLLFFVPLSQASQLHSAWSSGAADKV